MAIVTGDRYLDALVKFVEAQSSALLEGTLVLKLNPVGLHYVHSRIEQLQELESLLAGAPVDYLRAYISDLGDHRALEQLRRILGLLTSLKVVSVLPSPARDPTPISLLPFGRLKVLELRGCDLSTSAARGLLELRHTLEKLICHNSTDALRHVFASRIMDIRESPTWNKLTFVSCACNGLVLMDESLQLLPSVETLDLSRNRFAKVDNLRRCIKLRHLDLGFNHLRTVASLSEVSYNIVKLILRNNALTTLRGIENLKSIEGLDLSYNVISNFSELEFLGILSSLKNLWLEGNPFCCARWYRAQVFSYFSSPQQLTLDERGISTQETWKRHIILASRQKQPAGYGFYSPAKAESEPGSNNARRKMSRLAFIEEEEKKSFFGSETADLESVSCDSGYVRNENSISDGEAEIANLMNKIELMKRERSVLWWREFQEWMDHNPGDRAEDSKFSGLQLIDEKCRKSRNCHNYLGENSCYAPDLVHDSGDESSTNFLESDTSFTDSNIGFSGRDHVESSSKAILDSPVIDGIPDVKPALQQERMDSAQEKLRATQEELSLLPFNYTLTSQGGIEMERRVSMTSLIAIDEIMESHSSNNPGSPPHFQEDILHRRHNWEEEFLQFSAESFSLASSDSDTSCDNDSCKNCMYFPAADQAFNRESMNPICNDQSRFPSDEGDGGLEEPDERENGRSMLHYYAEMVSTTEVSKPDVSTPFLKDGNANDVGGNITDGIHGQGVECMERKRGKRKSRKRIISLSGENLVQHSVELPQAINAVLESDEINGDERLKQRSSYNNSQNFLDKDEEQALADEVKNLHMHCVSNSDMATRSASPTVEMNEIIKNYFDENVADSRVSEVCLQCICCHCMLHQESGYEEKEVALLRSSESKLYVILLDASLDERGSVSKVLGCHRLEDVKEIVGGIGLQVLRLYIEGSVSYLFITRSIEKSRGLLSLLQVCDSSGASSRCSIKSWEQVQIRFFEDSICGGVKMSIFQYSMLLFWHNHRDGESWLSRSLFVIAEHVLVCSEDILQFCSDDLGLSSPYFSLDSYCSVCSISEMVIESKENRCLTMSLDSSECSRVDFLSEDKKRQLGLTNSSPLTWKLKWFSEDAIFKFVALIKAIHLATAMSSLSIRCIA